MTTLNSGALRAMRLRFGDLTDDILLLRGAGRIVRPEGDLFAVDGAIVYADGLAQLANDVRARKAAWEKRKSRETADGNPAGRESRHDRQPDGPGSALANPFATDGEDDERSRTAGAGNTGDDRLDRKNAPIDLRVSEADGRPIGADGSCPGGSEGIQRRARRGAAGRTGQDIRDPRAPLQCDVGQRGDHAPAGRDAEDVAHAAPEGCVDGVLVVPGPTETIVPPCHTPQADEGPALPATPVPEEGVGAGPIQRLTALEADLADLKANLRDALRELLARIDAGEGR